MSSWLGGLLLSCIKLISWLSTAGLINVAKVGKILVDAVWFAGTDRDPLVTVTGVFWLGA